LVLYRNVYTAIDRGANSFDGDVANPGDKTSRPKVPPKTPRLVSGAVAIRWAELG